MPHLHASSALLFLLPSLLAQVTGNAVVPLRVFFESLCPDSLALFRSGLDDFVDAFDGHLSLHLNPLGRAKIREENGTLAMECSHGPAECARAQRLACVLNSGEPRERTLRFVFCVMKDVSTAEESEVMAQCSQRTGMDLQKLDSCYRNQNGIRFLQQYEQEMRRLYPTVSSYPHILIGEEDGVIPLARARAEICIWMRKHGHRIPAACSQ